MKKILVAGCGHGGLYAAYALSKAGYDVTVIEAKERGNLGHDWHDVIYPPDFERLGIPLPGCDEIIPFYSSVYTNPSKTVKLRVDLPEDSKLRCVDRKFLLKFLVEKAESAGVKIRFGEAVKGAVIKNNEVRGLETDAGTELSDLVIDAAGIDSPVRKSLPQGWGIYGEMPEENTFYTYRVYYKNTTHEVSDPAQTIYFYHCGKPGMDWSVSDRDFVDILVGRFYPITMEDVDEAVADVRSDCPYMGDKIIRGGRFEKIPLRLPLPLFVWNGYAAVGDSAGMTEPMSGSGINNSIKAGAILADTVIGARGGRLTLEALWRYQYTYFRQDGEGYFSAEIVRKMLQSLSAKDIDYFFEKRILTEKELKAGGLTASSPGETVSRILAFIPKLNLLPALSGVPYKNSIAEKAKKIMPEKYSREAYLKWRREFERI